MKTNKWIYAIVIAASLGWAGCDEDEDNPINKPDLNDTDEMFVEVAARSNMAEIEFGELAATKASDSLVKSFAQLMVDEHTTAQNELEDLADDFDGIDWPNDLSEGHDSIMSLLDNASGHAFDTLYMRTQIAMHEDAATAFQAATANTTNARVKAYANKYHPHIEMHLTKADSIQAVIIAGDITADATSDAEGGTGASTDDGTAGTGTDDGGTDDGTTDAGTADGTGGTTDGGVN